MEGIGKYDSIESAVLLPTTNSVVINMGMAGCTMMTSSNRNIFGVTGPLRRESIGQQQIPLLKVIDAKLW